MTRRKGKRTLEVALASDVNATTAGEKGPELEDKGVSSTDMELKHQITAIKPTSYMEVVQPLNEDPLLTPFLASEGNAKTVCEKGPEMEKMEGSSTIRDLERQISAMVAISDLEIEQLRTGVRLIRSYLTEDQLKTPALQFFYENLPNVSVIGDSEGEHFDLRWKDEIGNLSMYQTSGWDVHAPLLNRMSMAYPSCSDVRQSFGGHQFSARTVKSLGVADDLQIGNYMSQESLNMVMLGVPEGFHTPGPTSQRLSLGMTPKSVRLPKHGEMLLSVHGSPLGVYKEDTMEAIHESEEG